MCSVFPFFRKQVEKRKTSHSAGERLTPHTHRHTHTPYQPGRYRSRGNYNLIGINEQNRSVPTRTSRTFPNNDWGVCRIGLELRWKVQQCEGRKEDAGRLSGVLPLPLACVQFHPLQNPLVLEGCSFSPERQHSKPAKSLSMSINGQAGRQVRPSAYRLHICIPLGSRAAAAAAAAAGGF